MRIKKILAYMVVWFAYYAVLGYHSWRALAAGCVLVVAFWIVDAYFEIKEKI